MVPSNLIPAVTVGPKSIDWNSLTARQFICIERVDRGTPYFIMGEVEQLERLRNCHMLHLRVQMVFDKDGFTVDRWEFKRMWPQSHGSRFPFKVEWKKPKGAQVWSWSPSVTIHLSTRPAHQSRYAPPPPPPPPPPTEEPDTFRLNPELDELLKKRAQHRQAHAQHRALLSEARMNVGDALRLLGLSYESGYAEFKMVRRKLMLEFHPDLETQHVLTKGEGARNEFRRNSQRVVEALALVENIVKSNAN